MIIIIGICLLILAASIIYSSIVVSKAILEVAKKGTQVVNNLPPINIPSVFSGTAKVPEGKLTRTEGPGEPVVVPAYTFDDSKIESNLKVKDNGSKKSLKNIKSAAQALKKTLKGKGEGK